MKALTRAAVPRGGRSVPRHVERLDQADDALPQARLGEPGQRLQEVQDDLVAAEALGASARAAPLGGDAVLLLVQFPFLNQLPQPLAAALEVVLALVEQAALDQLVNAPRALAARLGAPRADF